jgi:thiamine kinase
MTKILSSPIAHGRTAEIYPWDEGWVVKLFYNWFGKEAIQYEARIARAVYASGMPIPEPGEMVEVDGRTGLTYRRVEGQTMLEDIQTRAWRLFRQARRLAELHVEMHAIRTRADLPRQHDELRRKIKGAPGLEAGLKRRLLNELEGMPPGDRLCHGDFHPGNVILTPKEPVVIDWIDAVRGNPLADVARTSVLLLGTQARGASPLIHLMLDWLHRRYLKRYFELSPSGEREYQAWIPIVAAARMSEGIQELNPWLARLADGGRP